MCRDRGFYFGATEATDADSLRLLAYAHAEHTGQRVPLALSSWEQAVDVDLPRLYTGS